MGFYLWELAVVLWKWALLVYFLSCQSANKWDHFIWSVLVWSVHLWSCSSITWAGEMTENHFSVRVFVQPVIQTLTHSSVLKSDMFGHTVIETDNFNAMSLPLSLSGVMSMILVVLSMIIMLWLYIWIYIASNLNQVPTHYGHVIMCQITVSWF